MQMQFYLRLFVNVIEIFVMDIAVSLRLYIRAVNTMTSVCKRVTASSINSFSSVVFGFVCSGIKSSQSDDIVASRV